MMFFTRTCVLLVAVLGVNAVFADMMPFLGNSGPQSMFIGSVASPQSTGKIVGGTAAVITNFPFQLSLRVGGNHYCGASLISPLWAVTAAHCSGYPETMMTLVAGSANMASGGTSRPVAQKFVHPSWNSTTIDYDIALLKVATAFPLSTSIAVIKLHAAGLSVPHDTPVTVSGWGSMVYGGCLPDQLQTVTVPAINTTYCQKIWNGYPMTITPRMLCAGGIPTGGKGSCKGDSGGPMTAMVSAVKTLVGVVSWGYPCGYAYIPDVYTRVSEVRAWINATSGI